MLKKWYIYGLHLEGDDHLRYIGSTTNPQARLSGHRNEYKSRRSLKNDWVKANRDHVRMKILQEGVGDDRKLAERRAMYHHERIGNKLFNQREPTLEAAKVTPEIVSMMLDVYDISPREAVGRLSNP